MMKYVFNREEREIKDWEKINAEMEKNLEKMSEEAISREEMEAFILKAVRDASVNEEKYMAFWNYDEPWKMPSDARCEYVYKLRISVNPLNHRKRHQISGLINILTAGIRRHFPGFLIIPERHIFFFIY